MTEMNCSFFHIPAIFVALAISLLSEITFFNLPNWPVWYFVLQFASERVGNERLILKQPFFLTAYFWRSKVPFGGEHIMPWPRVSQRFLWYPLDAPRRYAGALCTATAVESISPPRCRDILSQTSSQLHRLGLKAQVRLNIFIPNILPLGFSNIYNFRLYLFIIFKSSLFIYFYSLSVEVLLLIFITLSWLMQPPPHPRYILGDKCLDYFLWFIKELLETAWHSAWAYNWCFGRKRVNGHEILWGSEIVRGLRFCSVCPNIFDPFENICSANPLFGRMRALRGLKPTWNPWKPQGPLPNQNPSGGQANPLLRFASPTQSYYIYSNITLSGFMALEPG